VLTLFGTHGDGNANAINTAIWYLNNNVQICSADGPTLPSGWFLFEVGDFNGDGKPDYVLKNFPTYQTALWYLNNNVRVGSAYGPTFPSGWDVFELVFSMETTSPIMSSCPLTKSGVLPVKRRTRIGQDCVCWSLGCPLGCSANLRVFYGTALCFAAGSKLRIHANGSRKATDLLHFWNYARRFIVNLN
jgi:hypothetical protein